MTKEDRRVAHLVLLLSRLDRVNQAFPGLRSPHEAYGVLAEEVSEFFDEVKKKPHLRSSLAMRNEAIDIAVVAIRIVEACERGDSSWEQ